MAGRNGLELRGSVLTTKVVLFVLLCLSTLTAFRDVFDLPKMVSEIDMSSSGVSQGHGLRLVGNKPERLSLLQELAL